MKNRKNLFRIACAALFLFTGLPQNSRAQESPKEYWNIRTQLTPLRLPPPPVGYKPEYLDLNGDGKPDAIKSVTHNNIPILWLDDDGNMKEGDLEGDMVNDCLLIDRNRDGIYGGQGDLIIDWVDTDGDGKADMQIVIEYPKERTGEVWPNGHYMIMLDLDHDNVFNYINWNNFTLQCWDRSGLSDFYEDYSGQSAFMKIHTSTYDMKDLRLNWENPCSTAMVSTKTKSRRARGSKKPPITNSTPASITQECALCGASMGRSIFRKECHSLKCLRIIRSQWPSSSLGNCMNMV